MNLLLNPLKLLFNYYFVCASLYPIVTGVFSSLPVYSSNPSPAKVTRGDISTASSSVPSTLAPAASKNLPCCLYSASLEVVGVSFAAVSAFFRGLNSSSLKNHLTIVSLFCYEYFT